MEAGAVGTGTMTVRPMSTRAAVTIVTRVAMPVPRRPMPVPRLLTRVAVAAATTSITESARHRAGTRLGGALVELIQEKPIDKVTGGFLSFRNSSWLPGPPPCPGVC